MKSKIFFMFLLISFLNNSLFVYANDDAHIIFDNLIPDISLLKNNDFDVFRCLHLKMNHKDFLDVIKSMDKNDRIRAKFNRKKFISEDKNGVVDQLPLYYQYKYNATEYLPEFDFRFNFNARTNLFDNATFYFMHRDETVFRNFKTIILEFIQKFYTKLGQPDTIKHYIVYPGYKKIENSIIYFLWNVDMKVKVIFYFIPIEEIKNDKFTMFIHICSPGDDIYPELVKDKIEKNIANTLYYDIYIREALKNMPQ